MLKKLRFLLAGITGLLFTFYFLDFAGWTDGWLNLARLQLVPALLAGSLLVVVALILVTLVFGRIYCSVICPLGIFQDVVAWLALNSKILVLCFPSAVIEGMNHHCPTNSCS